MLKLTCYNLSPGFRSFSRLVKVIQLNLHLAATLEKPANGSLMEVVNRGSS